MKKIAIITSDNTDIILSVKNYFHSKDVSIEEVFLDKIESGGYDLVVYTGFEYINHKQENSLYIHPSLIPAFDEENALVKSFTYGIKVGGITVLNGNRILAQYPILIGSVTHFDEYKNEIIEISSKIYPVVINSVLEDRVFDFFDLFTNACSHNCKACKNN